jgi:hypothetical protein
MQYTDEEEHARLGVGGRVETDSRVAIRLAGSRPRVRTLGKIESL